MLFSINLSHKSISTVGNVFLRECEDAKYVLQNCPPAGATSLYGSSAVTSLTVCYTATDCYILTIDYLQSVESSLYVQHVQHTIQYFQNLYIQHIHFNSSNNSTQALKLSQFNLISKNFNCYFFLSKTELDNVHNYFFVTKLKCLLKIYVFAEMLRPLTCVYERKAQIIIVIGENYCLLNYTELVKANSKKASFLASSTFYLSTRFKLFVFGATR